MKLESKTTSMNYLKEWVKQVAQHHCSEAYIISCTKSNVFSKLRIVNWGSPKITSEQSICELSISLEVNALLINFIPLQL